LDSERPPALESSERQKTTGTRAFALEFSLRAGASLAKGRLRSKGVAPWFGEAGPEVRATLFRYVSLGIGMRGVFGSDRASFRQAACEVVDDQVTSNCGTFSSDLMGISVHAKLGALYRWALSDSWQAVADGALGYRTLSLHRSITAVDCRSCTDVSLQAKGGFYVTPQIDFIHVTPHGRVGGFGVTFGGEIYVSGDLWSALWGGFVVKFW
jgi:hypothetical protein